MSKVKVIIDGIEYEVELIVLKNLCIDAILGYGFMCKNNFSFDCFIELKSFILESMTGKICE